VLVAPDLDQRRLRLTSLLLALPRAAQRWRIDLRGACEPFGVVDHLRRNALPVVRHALACAIAAVAAEPILRVVAGAMRTTAAARDTSSCCTGRPPSPLSARPPRILYLRSQLWLGLAGGGSVAHTAGVIGGLQHAGALVDVVSS